MSRRVVITSYVRIVGKLWMPGVVAATETVLNDYDLENMRDADGRFTRDSVEHWVCLHSGDFSEIIDFRAEIEDGAETYTFDWEDEENEYTYIDCMYPPDEDDFDDEE